MIYGCGPMTGLRRPCENRHAILKAGQCPDKTKGSAKARVICRCSRVKGLTRVITFPFSEEYDEVLSCRAGMTKGGGGGARPEELMMI